jgi:hypothetical protein
MSHLNGSLELEQDGLGDEDLAGLGAEIADLGLQQLDLLAWAAAPHLQEAVDYGIEVDVVLVRHCRIPSILLAETMARKQEMGLGRDRQIPQAATEKKGEERQTRKQPGYDTLLALDGGDEAKSQRAVLQ